MDRSFFGNSIRDYAVALGVALVIVLTVHLTTTVLRRRFGALAERTSVGIDDVLVDVLGATRLWLATAIAAWAGALALTLPARWSAVLERVALFAFFLQLGIWLGATIRGVAVRLRQRKVDAGDLSSIGVIGMMALLARVVAWCLIGLLILENLGVDITALVAGLGIGGIAIALAAQKILGDLFASISIIFDKPFAVGDSIAVGDLSGTVEQIGLKTTRVRSGSGEELILPNGDLLDSRIKNYRRLAERRVVVTLGVDYATPRAELAALPDAVRAIVTAEREVRLDRVHLTGLGDSAALFELVYFVTSADHALYMDIRQRVNLALLAHLEARGVALAYPSRTVYLRDDVAAGPRRSPRALSSPA